MTLLFFYQIKHLAICCYNNLLMLLLNFPALCCSLTADPSKFKDEAANSATKTEKTITRKMSFS